MLMRAAYPLREDDLVSFNLIHLMCPGVQHNSSANNILCMDMVSTYYMCYNDEGHT